MAGWRRPRAGQAARIWASLAKNAAGAWESTAFCGPQDAQRLGAPAGAAILTFDLNHFKRI
jgi:hypothetical protein